MLPKINQTLEQARTEYSNPLDRMTRPVPAPRTVGDLPGFSPASQEVIDESLEQASRVRATRSQEKSSKVKDALMVGGAVLVAAGVILLATPLGEKYIAHENAPWKNLPAQTP